METNAITGDTSISEASIPSAQEQKTAPSPQQVKIDKVFIGPDSLVYTSLREYKEYHGLI